MIINFEDVIMNYSDDCFDLSKKYLSDFVSCFYADYEDLGRSEIIEKICDYTMMFEMKNSKKDSSIPELYVSELLPIINKMVKAPKKDEVPCLAYRYAQRAQEITERIKKEKSEDPMADLEDISKIFLCLYDHYLKNNHEKIETIDFKIPGIGFDYIRTDLIKEKSPILKMFKNKADEETVYNVLQANNKNNIYNVRNYVVMILSLFYVRLVELEGK